MKRVLMVLIAISPLLIASICVNGINLGINATPYVNALHYGATAASGDNDTTGLAAAVATGKPVYLPPGEYQTQSDLTLNSGQRIFGADWTSELKVVGSGVELLIDDDCVVENLKITGDGNQSCVRTLYTAAPWTIRHCEITAGTYGIEVSEGYSGLIAECEISAVTACIAFTDTSNPGSAVNNQIVIRDCRIQDAVSGITFLNGSGADHKSIHIIGCAIEANTTYGINAGDKPFCFTIQNCWFEQNGHNIYLNDAAEAVVIENNHFWTGHADTENTYYAILIPDSTLVDTISIHGNRFKRGSNNVATTALSIGDTVVNDTYTSNYVGTNYSGGLGNP